MPIRKPNQRDLDPKFMQAINLLGYGTVNEFALAKGIPYMTVLRYADMNEKHRGLETLIVTAAALDISTDEFVSMLLSKSAQKRSVG